MKRQNNGRPFDHPVSRRRIALAGKVNRTFPRLAGSLSSFAMDKIFLKQNPEYKTEWKFLPAQGMAHSPAIINDDLINRLLNHDIINLSGLLRFTPTGIVTADQGEVQVDAVILATGSHFDYSILSDEANPTAFPAPEWEECEHRNELAFPRLYQTLFSTRYPDSLAFIGPCRGYTFAVLANNDVVSTAIARTWRGSYTLPSQSEMEAWCDANYNRALRMIKTWRIPKTGTDPSAFEQFLNEAAGNQVNDILGWGWEGWKFWWTERELYGLIMDGICTPFVYRLMEGKEGARKKWEGAREAIYKANGKVLG